LGVLFGRESWLGVPTGIGVVLYAVAIALIAAFILGDLGWFLFCIGFVPLLSHQKNRHQPSSASPRPTFRQTWALATTNPFALSTVNRMDSVDSLAPIPTPDASFGVEIMLRRKERITGGDLGVVVFSEGWLVYEGRTTAFSLAPAHVRKVWPGTTAWTLYLTEGQRLTLVSYDPGWREAIERWTASPGPPGLSRLPPLAPNVIVRLRTPGYLHLGAAILAGVGLASIFASGGFVGVAVLALLLFALGSLIAWRRR